MEERAKLCQVGIMQIYGIDFTSRPTKRKPITCLSCTLDGDRLEAGALNEWTDFENFEAALQRAGPWIAGIDFPFGQSRRFIENANWPKSWQGYIDHVATMTRAEFRQALDTYRKPRAQGDKEHRRATDTSAGSISPQKLYGTPVGLMFYEGAKRLRQADVTIPHLQQGDPDRIVVEGYPGVLARNIIGRRSYKQDTKKKQTTDQHEARKELLQKIINGVALEHYGIHVEAPKELADDPTGDQLDALLCSIQTAWSWTQRSNNYGAPKDTDTLEGWIADPTLTPPSPGGIQGQ